MHKPILITGASGGIGEAAAVHLATKGFKVYAGARRKDKLEALSGLGQGRIIPLLIDVTDDGSVAEALALIERNGDRLYGLINNAGVSVVGPSELVPLNEWRRQFETNVFGMISLIQAVAPQMRAAGEGRIVNIGSIAGRIVSPFMGPYAASKHAVEGLSDAFRRELRPYGVKVSVIRPGFVNTSFGTQAQDGLSYYLETDGPYERQLSAFKAWHAKAHPTAESPHIVAEKIYHALTAAHPHSRYTAPPKYLGLLLLRNLLPSAIIDRLFERIIGLKK